MNNKGSDMNQVVIEYTLNLMDDDGNVMSTTSYLQHLPVHMMCLNDAVSQYIKEGKRFEVVPLK